MGYELLKKRPELLPAGEISFFDNMKVIIETPEKLPPPYNGAHREVKGKDDLDEVTYENSRGLGYYDDRPRHKIAMNYVYSLIPRADYEKFWNEYRIRYEDLKQRHLEAYEIL